MTMADLQGAFIMILVGWIIFIVGFMGEIMFWKQRRQLAQNLVSITEDSLIS